MHAETIEFGPWRLLANAEGTRRGYAQLGSGAETCGCAPCRNFVAARESVYPPDVRVFLERLGTDYRKECEVAQVMRTERGHEYSGWFHFLGELTEGPDAYVTSIDRRSYRFLGELTEGPDAYVTSIDRRSYRVMLVPFGESFEMGVTRITSLVPEVFKGQRVLQLKFAAVVPWVIEEPQME